MNGVLSGRVERTQMAKKAQSLPDISLNLSVRRGSKVPMPTLSSARTLMPFSFALTAAHTKWVIILHCIFFLNKACVNSFSAVWSQCYTNSVL